MLWLVVFSLEQEAECCLKITLAKEENMHRGSETKFPWWYFLHTGGILAGEWGAAYTRERTTASVYTKTSPSPSVSLPIPPSPITTPSPHLSSTSQPFTSMYPLFSLSLIQLFPSTFCELSTPQISWNGHINTDHNYFQIHPLHHILFSYWLTSDRFVAIYYSMISFSFRFWTFATCLVEVLMRCDWLL